MKIKNNIMIIFVFLTLLLLTIFFVFNNKHQSYALDMSGSEVSVNNPDTKQQKMNVLVIEINPLLNRITDKTLYPNNNGHPKVSEYFGQNSEISLNEIVKDIQETSHGYIKVSLKREWLNEFPTYKSKLELNNGKSAYRFDEDTYLKYANYNGTPTGDWNYLLSNNIFGNIEPYSFDYEYIINKFDLVNRRNKGEFDQVWLLSIDPTQTFETNMVGKSSFWVNGDAIKKDCSNFLLFNISISRRDANLHALGHGMEGILYSVSGMEYGADYIFNYYSVNNVEEYNKLNIIQKFFINSYNNGSNIASVGNIHFPFNGNSDYDYTNTNKVYTNWREWLNYPNIKGKFVLDNNNAWQTNAGNNKLGSDQNTNPDRLYSRFWFYLMPHIKGYNADGYLNNWWKYLYSLDYVTDVVCYPKITVKVNDFVALDYKIKYYSGKKDIITYVKQGDNIHISNPNVLSFKDGYLYAVGVGKSEVEVFHDGKGVKTTITVIDDKDKTYMINFEKGNAKSIEKKSLSCKYSGENCNLTMPKITAQDGYEVVGWGTSDKATQATYLPGKSYTISQDMTLYAITKTTYTIKFIKNSAKSIGAASFSCTTTGTNCQIMMPQITPQDRWEVVGWGTRANDKEATYLPGNVYNISQNMTLYAITKAKVKNNYTITFDKNNAKSISSTSLSCIITGGNCQITMPQITAQDGYEAVGWGLTAKDTQATYLPGNVYNISQNMTLYAITKVKPKKTYTVTFDKTRIKAISSTSESCTTTGNTCQITMPKVTIADGYDFIGWGLTPKDTTAAYLPGKSYNISQNMTLYAITKVKPKKTYTVTFDKTLIKAISNTNISCTTTGSTCQVTMPKSIATDGYEFIGWGINSADTKATYLPGKSYNISNNMTLYPITKAKPKKTYTVTFNKNKATSISSTSLSCTTTGDSCKIMMPTITIQSGYKVVGWSTNKNSKEAEYNPNQEYDINRNITLYAIVESNNIDKKEYALILNILDNKTNQCVSGVEYIIRDSNNKDVKSGKSTCDGSLIKLKSGNYTIIQKKDVDGYATFKNRSFVIKNKDVKVTINISPIRVCFMKKANNKTKSYTIYNKSNMVVDTFTLSNNKICFDYFKIGEYYIVENNTGYYIKEDNVTDNNELETNIIVLDDEKTQTFVLEEIVNDNNNDEITNGHVNKTIWLIMFFAISVLIFTSSIVYITKK